MGSAVIALWQVAATRITAGAEKVEMVLMVLMVVTVAAAAVVISDNCFWDCQCQ